MSLEHMRVGMLMAAIERAGVPRSSVCQMKTDSVYFVPGKRRRKKVKPVISQIRYCDLADISMPADKRQRRLSEPIVLPRYTNEDRVFRCEDAQESDLMRCRPVKPGVEFSTHVAFTEWREIKAGDLVQHFLTGNSALINFHAGSGKTFLAKGCNQHNRSTQRAVKLKFVRKPCCQGLAGPHTT